jgi:DNA-binding MarR family transcriptional regulator
VATRPSLPAGARLDDLLLSLLDEMKSAFVRRLDEQGLSMPQALTLRLLDHPRPMRLLATAMGCDASNLTGIADRLEERGLVERRVDPHDRRVKFLVVTPRGERVRDVLHRGLAADLPGASRLSAADWALLEGLLWKLLAR